MTLHDLPWGIHVMIDANVGSDSMADSLAGSLEDCRF
jgi:hypothetical protein